MSPAIILFDANEFLPDFCIHTFNPYLQSVANDNEEEDEDDEEVQPGDLTGITEGDDDEDEEEDEEEAEEK